MNPYYSCVLLFVLLTKCLLAQTYTVSFPTNGYTANTSPTVVYNNQEDDAISSAISIGFNFQLGCTTYSQFKVSTNGFITFLTSGTDAAYANDLTNSTQKPILAPLWDDLAIASGGSINYKSTGSTPNRVLTIEWKQMQWDYGAGGDVISFQLKLYEANNTFEFVYSQGATAVNTGSASIGFATTTTAGDFYSLNGTGATPTLQYGTETTTLSTQPATGERYLFTQSGLAYSSSTTTQSNTSSVTKCDIEQHVIGIQVVASGGCASGTLSLTQFQINMTGSTIPGTNTNDVTKIHIYYTGTSSTYSVSNEFFAGGTTPTTGTISINGSQSLSSGTNYFWVAYDINSTSATTVNVIDAQCTQLTVGGGNYTPTATNPSGTRSIAACTSYPGASSSNIKLWLRANTGLTLSGSNVTQWNDQSGAAITGNFVVQTGSPTQSSPTRISNGLNFNNYIRFDGSTNSLYSSNSFACNTFFHANNNTHFTIMNLKAGTVWYKWEDAGSGSYRFGYERNGNYMRFDFVNDAGGKNNASTTNVLNLDILAVATTSSTNTVLSLNANTDATLSISSLSLSTSSSRRLCIGNNDLTTNNLPSQIDIAEIINYNTTLTNTEIRRVSSYLALKYGITLGNNKGTSGYYAYLASDGTQIWANQTGYHNNVIGIGLDNTSTLDQPKSTSVLSLNASTDILTLANGTNYSSPSSLTTDKSFLIAGHNSLATSSDVSVLSDLPSGIQSRIRRVWKAQETGTVGTVTLNFDLSTLIGIGSVSDLRLIVDADGVFASGATTVNSSASAAGYVQFQHDFSSSTGFYFTLASVNISNSPLPVTLLSMNVDCEEEKSIVKWTTATETQNDFFTIQRANDKITFQDKATIKGAGNSHLPVAYGWKDPISTQEPTYYRLKQTDYNGKVTFFPTLSSHCLPSPSISIFPNPVQNELWMLIKKDASDEAILHAELVDAIGKSTMIVAKEKRTVGEEEKYLFDTSLLAKGVYMLKINRSHSPAFFRIVKM
jgi:trimeric autotransporter adhesin